MELSSAPRVQQGQRPAKPDCDAKDGDTLAYGGDIKVNTVEYQHKAAKVTQKFFEFSFHHAGLDKTARVYEIWSAEVKDLLRRRQGLQILRYAPYDVPADEEGGQARRVLQQFVRWKHATKEGGVAYVYTPEDLVEMGYSSS